MTQLLDIFGFLSVLLRGLTLAFEALTVGGVIFLVVVAQAVAGGGVTRRLSQLLACFAGLLAGAQACYVAANYAILIGTTDITWADVSGAGFSIAGALVVVGAIVVAISARALAKEIEGKSAVPGRPTTVRLRSLTSAVCLVAGAVILSGSVMTSHSVSRLEHRWALTALTLAHHVAGAAWIGGMPYLIASLRHEQDAAAAAVMTSRFSRMALGSVAVLAVAGAGLSYSYVGSLAALGGTTYGIMLMSKVVLTLLVLILGALNFKIVRAVWNGLPPEFLKLRRFAEAETGIGFTILLAAASLTSTPPAIDVRADVVTGPEVAQRMKPQWPRMQTPAFSELSPATPFAGSPAAAQSGSYLPGQAPYTDTPADTAWSEYNHHWAGLLVLAIGVVSLLAPRFSWAHNWPLLFLGLALFLLIRADSENWPLGPRGFWESFQVAEVAQHRIFVLLIVAFALFEWAVQTSRLPPARAGLVFPLVCAIGGALLLTHSHSLTNAKQEFLAELSHIPLAILAVVAGWSRWLEIRLPKDRFRVAAWIWPICFVLIGAILMNYRES